ncbi:DUF1783-domain-containing protein [Wilcoxina mikolae CBS 423.85]|nr:DUF1783-domain-containing protein [Wilcoxina mikolae CBS 423.85]
MSGPVSRRGIAVHPRTGGNPFIERQANRALPDVESTRRFNLLTIPVFLVAVTGSCLAIFNYQKSSSSVVASTLYALRVHPQARALLGDEIQFKHHFPIIWGELNQLHGNIDINYTVKGTKGEGTMRFKSTRKTRMGLASFRFTSRRRREVT